jgi:DNA-binding MarR family transcriptional regulator
MQNNSHEDSLEAEAQRLHQLMVLLSRRHSLRDPIAANCEHIHHLTHPQIHALLHLGHEGGLTMGELARRIGVTEKTVTGIVDRLERETYLQRERDATDRRVVRVCLTPKGREAHERIDAEIHRHIKEILGLLDPPDRQDLFRILEKIQRRFGSKAPAADTGASEPASASASLSPSSEQLSPAASVP